MKKENSNGLQAIVSQALATLKEKNVKYFDLQNVNLAELQRMTGISRSRLRRLKENNFQVKPHWPYWHACQQHRSYWIYRNT